MSDGLTDRRSQSEPLLSQKQLVEAESNLEENISRYLFKHMDFGEFKVRQVRDLAKYVTSICVSELRKVEK